MTARWEQDGSLSDRCIAPREDLSVSGPMDDGRFSAVAYSNGRRAEKMTDTPEEGRAWADSQVRDGHVVPDELAARRVTRARQDEPRSRGRSR